MNRPYWPIIIERARAYDLEPNLIAAIISVESNWDTYANRVEFKRLSNESAFSEWKWVSRWRWFVRPRYYAKKNMSSLTTEIVNQATSFGLCQVMGGVAREHGYEGWLPGVCDPSVGIELGCQHLRKRIDQYGSVDNGIEAYNAGRPGRRAGIAYRMKVTAQINRLRESHSGDGRG